MSTSNPTDARSSPIAPHETFHHNKAKKNFFFPSGLLARSPFAFRKRHDYLPSCQPPSPSNSSHESTLLRANKNQRQSTPPSSEHEHRRKHSTGLIKFFEFRKQASSNKDGQEYDPFATNDSSLPRQAVWLQQMPDFDSAACHDIYSLPHTRTRSSQSNLGTPSPCPLLHTGSSIDMGLPLSSDGSPNLFAQFQHSTMVDGKPNANPGTGSCSPDSGLDDTSTLARRRRKKEAESQKLKGAANIRHLQTDSNSLNVQRGFTRPSKDSVTEAEMNKFDEAAVARRLGLQRVFPSKQPGRRLSSTSARSEQEDISSETNTNSPAQIRPVPIRRSSIGLNEELNKTSSTSNAVAANKNCQNGERTSWKFVENADKVLPRHSYSRQSSNTNPQGTIDRNGKRVSPLEMSSRQSDMSSHRVSRNSIQAIQNVDAISYPSPSPSQNNPHFLCQQLQSDPCLLPSLKQFPADKGAFVPIHNPSKSLDATLSQNNQQPLSSSQLHRQVSIKSSKTSSAMSDFAMESSGKQINPSSQAGATRDNQRLQMNYFQKSTVPCSDSIRSPLKKEESDSWSTDSYDEPWDLRHKRLIQELANSHLHEMTLPHRQLSAPHAIRGLDSAQLKVAAKQRPQSHFTSLENTPMKSPQSNVGHLPLMTMSAIWAPCDEQDSDLESIDRRVSFTKSSRGDSAFMGGSIHEESIMTTSLWSDGATISLTEAMSPLPRHSASMGSRYRHMKTLSAFGSSYPLPETCIVDVSLPLEQQCWYHGEISRSKAEEHLKTAFTGDFLVRRSETSRHAYSLSIRHHRHYMHMIISRTLCVWTPISINGDETPTATTDPQAQPQQQVVFILGQHSQPFPSVPLMMRHYQDNILPVKGAEAITLHTPIPRM